MKHQRQSNYEWLRILAMGMIISLHYFFKGGIISMPVENFSGVSVTGWLITSFCMCAVNTYILISGYFLVEAEFKPGRLLALLVQVLEYSLIVLLVLILTGTVNPSEMNLYSWLGYLFPVGTEEYWFVSSYFLMYLIAPVLAGGVKSLNRKTLRSVLWMLLAFECVEKSILPMLLPGDKYGYDLIWFMVLFVTAAYIRLYGIDLFTKHRWLPACLFTGSSLLIFGMGLLFSYAGLTVGSGVLLHYADITSHYNFIPVYTASVGLFYIFRNASFNEEGIPARAARVIGHLTFGVYLLHEHPEVRSRWPGWLNVRSDRTVAGMILHWIVCLPAIYAAGLLAEYVRDYVHRMIKKVIEK